MFNRDSQDDTQRQACRQSVRLSHPTTRSARQIESFMPVSHFEFTLNSVFAFCALLVASMAEATAQGTAPAPRMPKAERPAWLDGSGEDMRMRVSGSVLFEDGKPASDFEILATQEIGDESRNLAIVAEGNRFSFWVPVGELRWFRVSVTAATLDGELVGRRTIAEFQLRQAAVEGIELTLRKFQRSVSVTVLDQEAPVPSAIVTARLQTGDELTAVANADGVAVLRMMNRDRLAQLTARMADLRIGGFTFYRDPPRDTAGSQFTVELEACHRQTVRLVDVESETPIPNLSFLLTVGTGPPNYQFVGKTPDSQLTTDHAGEAVHRWFPNWKQHTSYVSVFSKHWVTAGRFRIDDGVIVFPLKRSKFDKRKRVAGRIESAKHNPAGICVAISSFQGEAENTTDSMRAVADENGVFEANYLPGATYCFAVQDERVVSKLIDLIPWDADAKKIAVPVLALEDGQLVEVSVTSGPRKRPIPYHFVQMETEHNYSWIENGEEQFGGGSRRWWVVTNKYGRAFTYALGGQQVQGSVYSPEWRAKKKIEVRKESTNRLRIHREVDAPRKVFGRLIPPPNVDCVLADALIQIGAVDGETKERMSVTANVDGTYSFDSQSLRVGIFVRTKDGKAAAGAMHLDLDEPADVQLFPTVDFHGQLLDDNGEPVASHRMFAIVRVYGERKANVGFGTFTNSQPIETTTAANGHFTLRNLPPDVEFLIEAAASDGSKTRTRLATRKLAVDDDSERAVFRIGRK